MKKARNPLSMSPLSSKSSSKGMCMSSLSSSQGLYSDLSMRSIPTGRKAHLLLKKAMTKLSEKEFTEAEYGKERRKILYAMEENRISSLPGQTSSLYIYMTSSMVGKEDLEEKRAVEEKRKVSFWPSNASVSGHGRLRTISVDKEDLDDLIDFVESHGCTWQEA